MIRRVLAQLLIGTVLAGSAPASRPGAPEARPLWVPAPAAAPAPLVAPSEIPAPTAVSTEISTAPEESPSSAVHLAEGAEIEALPVDVRQLLQAPSVEDAADASLAPLRLAADRPVPGIQKDAHNRSAGRSVQEVQPPQAPQAVVAEAPDEYAAVTARAEESALPARPRLTVRPAVLRFALTREGVLPAAQSLEISSDRRAGARFEVAGSAGWLAVEAGRGRAGLSATAVQVAVDGRKIAGPLSGQLEVRNLDDPSDVQRIAVEVERAEPGRLLRSRDADGRLQRVVRPDGGILDYDYDPQGRLTRVRRPDGSAVTWSYDDLGRRIAMTDERGTTVYRYDSRGRLDAVYTPGFEPVRYGYDERSRLTTLHLPGGKAIAWEYDEADRLLAVRSDLGTTRYGYDAVTRKLAERVLPNGVATHYGYDAAGRLTGVTHLGASGEPLLSFSWSLDEQGRPVRVTRESSAGGETTDLAYDTDGRVASADSSTGRLVTYDYDGLGRRTRTVETRGARVQVTDYAYDDLGRLARAGDEVFVYDAAGDLVRRVSPDRTVEYRWDFEGRLTGFNDGRHKVEYVIDGDGRRVGVTVDGREVSRLHDASGWIGGVLAEADAEGDVVRTHVHGFEPIAVEGKGGEGSLYLYDHPLRSAAALVAPSGSLAETFVSDPFGALQAPPDAALPPYLFAGGAYDPITGLIHRDGAEYDPRLGAFLPSAFDDESPDGSSGSPPAWGEQPPAGAFSEALVKAFRPDRPLPADPRDEPTAGRSSGQDPPAGSTAPLHVNIFQSNELPPSSERSKTSRSVLPFPYRLAPEEGSVYRRGTLPATRSLTAAPRLKLHPEYLPFAKTASGLLPASQTLEIASSDGQALSFTVEEDIPWLTVSAAGSTAPATLTVTVDPAGLTESGSPYVGDLILTNTSDTTDVRKVRARLLVRATGASVTLRSFDANGNLRRVVKPDGGIIDYEVDPLGRLIRVRYPGQPAVSYAYDGNGNRVSMTDQRGTTVYQYDRQNRLTGVFTPLSSNYIPVTYGYDKAGRLTSLATPDGRTVLYQYDAGGRMTRVTDGADVTTYTYNSVTGLLASQTLPNGITTAYTYDVDGRLTGIVHNAPGGSLLMGFHYTLNALGQRTSVTRQTSTGSELTSYTYDALGRLTSVTYPGGKTVSYTYDRLGNRLSMTTVQGGNTTVVNYEYDKDNRLLKAGDEVFQYDANGNMLRRSSPAGTTTYTYDARNLLTRVETEGRVVTFEYDGDGNRIAKDNNGLRTNFVNDDSGDLSQVLVEANASWQVQRSYSYGNQRIGLLQGSERHLYLTDGASNVALTAGDGSLEDSYYYDAFGRPIFAPSASLFLFDNEAFDTETELIYLRARYYDPSIGRFISRDPVLGYVSIPGTLNSYVFALADPVNLQDPTGLDTFQVGAGGTYSNNGLGGGAALQGVVDFQAADPLDWRFGVSFTIGGGPVTHGPNPNLQHIPQISGGALFSYSPNASSAADLRGPATFVGGTVGEGWTLGGGLTHSATADVYSLSVGRGGGAPLSYSAEGGFSYTFVSDTISPREVFNGIAGVAKSVWSWITDLGGVSLNKTAELLLSLQDVTGATFDEATGQLVILGKDNVSLPPLEMNHVAVATQSVFGGQDPGVSIDPPIVNNRMSVRYEGQTRDTEFGYVMFEADRVLKILTLGKDNITGQSVSSAVPGYKNMLRRRLDAGCGGKPTSTRMWFQPKEVRLVPSTDGKSMVFDAVSMELLYESKVGNKIVSDPQAAAFASHFTQNYAAFANEWTILKKLEQLGKIVAIIKWIKDNRIPIDLSFLDNYPIEFFSTVTSTPTVTVQGTRQIGPVTCTVSLQGGVTYDVPNQYLPADPEAGAALSEALAERPSEGTFKWTYQPSAGASTLLRTASGPVTAVAESLTRSRRDGNVQFQEADLSDPLPGGGALALLRTYNSFLDKTGPLGPGWSVLPAELRFPLKKERFTFGSANLALDLYARIWLIERTAGREDAYDLLGIDSSNLPIYRRADAMHVLRQQSDGTFRLTREDGSAAVFRADGKPVSLADRNGNAVAFVYDAQTPPRLLRLEGGGRSITLAYDAQGRLAQASGPGGREILYGYSAQGRLATVTDFAARSRTYGYDANGRLTSATDAEGRSIFTAGYDDYDRTPARRVGAAAQYGLDFDLGTGQSTTTDPFGRIGRQLFERRQLASPSGIRNEVYRPKETEDPLGNRTAVTWADDAFGPRAVTDAQGASTELAWDNRGHLTAVQDPLGETTERFYDWRDRLVAVRNPEGLATAYGYDDKNNPTTIYHDVSLTSDEEGNLTSFSYDPNNVSTFGYDAAGNLTAAANPLGQQAQVQNNAFGQPDRITSPSGVVSTLAYDARSRMTSSQTGGRQVTYGYDSADQVTSVTTVAGTTGLLRDVHGRVTRLRDALLRDTLFGYDTDGRLTRVDDAAGGVAAYSYDVLGHLLSADLPNGTANAWEYDELGRPVAALTGLGPVAPRLALAVNALDFGSVSVGTSRQLPLDLYNQGTAPLTVSGVTVSAPFSVAFSGPATIPPAGSLRVTVTFTPTDQVPASANLSITSDDQETPLLLVALSGEGARKVANLQATPAQDGIQLTWSLFNPGSQPFGRFNIYRSLTPIPGDVTGLASFDTSLTSATATSFLDKLAVPGTSYYYAITPVYANGDENKLVDPAGPVAYFTTFGPLAPDAGLATAAQSENRPAMAYNSTANEYLVVYERSISASNTDVYGQRVSATGSLVGSVILIANATNNERRPRLAYNANSNNYLVVWEYDASGTAGTNFDLRARTVSATGALGAVVTVANSALQDQAPEIAFGSTSREYLVSYETDGNGDGKKDLGLRRLSATGAVLAGLSYNVASNSVNVHVTNPHLAYSSTLNNFMVAFESDVANNGSNIEVWATRVKPDLALVDGFVLALGRTAVHDRNPYLTYDSTRDEYLFVWETDATGTGTDLGVYCRKLTSAGASGGILFGLASQARNPRAVYNRNLDDFVIVWEESGAGPKIRSRRVHFTITTFQTKTPVDVTSGTASRVRPDIGTSTVSNTFLVTWEEDAGSGNFDVRSRLLGTFAPTLQVSPPSLTFSGATAHQTLTVTNGNPSGGPLQWTAVPNVPWMTAQPGSGSTTSSVAVDVAVDRAGLAPGSYAGILRVNSNNGNVDVPVTLLVGNTPPDAPSAPRPADGAVDQASVSGGVDLTLGWQGGDADGDSVTWDIYLGTNSAQVTARDPAVRIGQGLTNPSVQTAGLAFLTQYFWRVVATDARGASTLGPVWRFTTAAVPAPALHPVTPDPTRETRPALTWQSVAGAASYQLQIAGNPGFSSPIVDQSGIAATSYTPSAALPEGTIYWRVRSLDAAGQPGAFSVSDTFVIDTTAAGVPVLVPVTPDPTNVSQPQLSWSEVAGAASYRVQAAGTSDFAAPLVDATVTTTTYQPAADLPEGPIYWRAASLDEAGNQSDFSGMDHFTLDVTPPPSITGLAAQRNGAGVDLTWEPLGGPPADFARFRIYRAEAPFSNVTGITLLDESLTSSAAASFRDPAAVPGVAYWYAVTAVDAAGNEDREVITAQVLANEPPVEPVLMAPAVGAQVLPSGDMAVLLAWSVIDPEGDPLRFEVYLSTDLAQVEGAPDITARVAEDLETPIFEAAGLNYQNTYHWRVVALDLAADGSVRSATFGPVWSFILPAIPAPVLTPVTPDPTQAPRPGFTWQSVTGAAGYRIELASDPAFAAVVAAAETTEASWTPGSDLPEGTLYWHVRAIDAQGRPGDFSAPDDFVLDRTAPAVPVLVPVTPDPTNNRRPSLAWGAVTGAASYQLQISTDPSFSSLLVDVAVAGTSYVPVSDLPEGSIYWRVASEDGLGNRSAFSAADDFVVDATAPSVPVLVPVTPDPTSNRRPSLNWGAVAGASSYRVQVSSAPDFAAPLVDTTVSTTSYQPVSDLPESRIYWRVASVDSVGNQSAFSVADDFLVDVTAPAVPVLVAVTPDPTSNRRSSLSWGAVAGASSYRVQVSSAPDFAAPLVDTTVSTTSYQPASDLPEGRIYWRVASVDAVSNQSAFSEADDFLVDGTAPAVPVLVAVTPDPTSNRRPSLSWGAVAGASSYRVQVSSAPDFAAPLVDTTVSTTSYQPASDLPESRIYWRVASVDSVGNQSAFSAADDFLVDVTAPAVPVLVAVTPDPTRNPRPLFGWAAIADVLQYRVQVSSDPGFAALLVNTVVSINSFQPVADLPEGRIYWRVASLDPVGNQSAFSASSFTSDRTPPSAVAGLSADWANPGTGLVWQPFPAGVTDVALLHVFRSDAPFTEIAGRTPLATLTDPLATSFADPTAVHGVVHHYAVTAVDQAGNELQAVTSAATPPPGGDLYTVAPCRVLDTRDPQGPYGGPALGAGQPRAFPLVGRCGIPATARAIVANLTVVAPTAAGNVRAYPGGIPAPTASVINFPADIVRANNAILGIQQDGTGTLILQAGQPAGATVHVLLDVTGYFE
jgi:RHS repeat-associated protein